MLDINPSRKLAAQTRSGNLLALLLPAALIPALLMLVLAGGATASAQVVTNSADSGPGTLRSAITNAAGGAVITFDPSLSGATITLGSTLTINTNLTIDASALPGGLQINGNATVTVFNVASTITVFLNSLTVTGGYSTNSGGGIYNNGTLTLTNCTLSGNSASGDGGGIYNHDHGALTLNQCTLSGNSADDGGGGICNFSGGTLALNQCTLSGNSANSAGGIANFYILTLNQCTLSGNSATDGNGGIDNYYDGELAMTNTIVAGNSGTDLTAYGAPVTYGGSNLVESLDNTGNGGFVTGPSPDLAPFGNYGGPTQTMPPLPGSPAIDAGSNAATNNFATDQRGLPRFVGPQVDIGAVEFQASPVVTNADSGPGSLRYAIEYVTNNATITFDPSLSGATITLSNTLTINTNLTIDASALSGGLQINGNGSVQIVNVASNITVFLNSLTITNGYSTNSDITNSGGGIYNGGTLTLNNCILSENRAPDGDGGGIDNYGGTLALTNCTLSGNSAFSGGGGIFNYGGTVTLNLCTLSGNGVTGSGGGIFSFHGPLTLNQCTLSGNGAALYGGGIDTGFGTVTLNQCTLSGNGADDGGGIYNIGTLMVTNIIVAENYAHDQGGDIYNYSGSLTYGGSNIVQSVYDNYLGTITGSAPLTDAPNLAPLGNYGGPTQTMPPLPGSPAIDAGSNAATNNFATDQRGLPRLVGPQVDIGAVEFQASQVVTNADSGPGSLRYAIEYVTNNATITFDPSLFGATITLGSTLTINTNLTIDASALSGGLQINGNGSVQIFNVASNITVFLNSLTVTNGYSAFSGGGIYSYGTLTLNQCTLSGNSAFASSGGIENFGTLTMNQCTLSGNSALASSLGGGGIENWGTLTMNQCTLSGNRELSDGGEGGGIYNARGALTLNECTLSGNSATFGGGGIYNSFGALTLNECTLSGNIAGAYGGGIYSFRGALALTNTIVAGNYPFYDFADIVGSVTYGGSNLVQVVYGSFTGPAALTNAPDLAPLGNYGGPTQTMPPLPGSPAIGAGSVAANTFSTDQRVYPRAQNGLIDIGAVELQPSAANPPVLGNIAVPAGGGNGLQFTFTNASTADFTVLTAINVSLALTNWTVLGEVQQVAPGQYQFTDPQAATNAVRFYRVRSP